MICQNPSIPVSCFIFKPYHLANTESIHILYTKIFFGFTVKITIKNTVAQLEVKTKQKNQNSTANSFVLYSATLISLFWSFSFYKVLIVIKKMYIHNYVITVLNKRFQHCMVDTILQSRYVTGGTHVTMTTEVTIMTR